MSAPSLDYYLLGDHFDLSSSIKQEAPPYVPDPLLPAYNLKPVSQPCPLLPSPTFPFIFLTANFPCSRCLMNAVRQRSIPSTLSEPARAIRVCSHSHHRPSLNGMLMYHHLHSTGLRGFDLAESIWSQDSDLTLDDIALESDSASARSRSSTSSRWSAAPLTPSTSPHRQPPPTRAPPPEPLSIPDHQSAAPSATESAPELPEEPAPAYSRDPLEFDPALLATLDAQLLSHPFEAFEDSLWACLADSSPERGPYTFHSLNPSLPQLHPPATQAGFTAHSSFSESTMATLVTPIQPPPPPPAYPTSKPLPNLPPPSPRSSAGHTQLPRSPVVMSFESFVTLEDPPYPTSPPAETVQFFPLRAPVRARSKSVGGTKPVRRLTGAIARLRGRE